MRAVFFTLALLGSISSFAETSDEAKQRIEEERAALCSYTSSTNRYCFNGTCRRWKNYSCTPDDITQYPFKIRMRVTTKTVRFYDNLTGTYRNEQVGDERVSSITILDR